MGSEGSRTQIIYSPVPPGFLHLIGKQKNVQANLECVQTHSSDAKSWWRKPGHQTGWHRNDNVGVGFLGFHSVTGNSGKCNEGSPLFIYLKLHYVLITKTAHIL